MRHFFFGPFAAEFEHAAFGHQGLDAGYAQLGGFFNQPVHAVVGRHAHHQMHRARGLALYRLVAAHLHLHVAAAHLGDGGVKLAPAAGNARPAVEQGDGVARLQAQHLHVAGGAGGQVQQRAGYQGGGAVKAGHGCLLLK